MHLAHKDVHKLEALFDGEPALPRADVEGVGEQPLVVCAEIDRDGEGRLGVDAAGGDVQAELALRDAHPADAEVSEPEHARAVGDDRDLHLVVREARLERGNDRAEVGQVRVREVERVDRVVGCRRRRVDQRPVLAREADDGRAAPPTRPGISRTVE